jgi:hypothetical protein
MKVRRVLPVELHFCLVEPGDRWSVDRVDNVNTQNYFSISKCEKEKEVKRYGMGTHEHPPF